MSASPLIISLSPPPPDSKTIKIRLLTNWVSEAGLARLWAKMSNYIVANTDPNLPDTIFWKDLTGSQLKSSDQQSFRAPRDLEIITDSSPVDYYVAINSTNHPYNPSKGLLFQMEPMMEKNEKLWGPFSHPEKLGFLKCCLYREGQVNLMEWHLSWSYHRLMKERITKRYSITLSAVLSDKYFDPGHIKRIDFMRYLEGRTVDINVAIYGSANNRFKNYQGSPPPHQKDEAMFPYKYHFNAENHSIHNYVTEKFVDAMLAECLIFYWGCPNLEEIMGEECRGCFIRLGLEDFTKDLKVIEEAIRNQEYEKRLPAIRRAKHKILNELQVFPAIKKVIESLK